MLLRLAWALVALHGAALALGLFGILIAIPHPERFAGNAAALAFFPHALNDTGGIGMILGALALLAYGCACAGTRRTAIFFAAATLISAAAELTGTATGWPFGGYEYTNFLGPKILGRVPFAIPLSWFYMGFAALLLADAAAALRGWTRPWLPIVGATWLLCAWDLTLDPSMAAPQLQYIHFWIWHETGPYFGMPLRNLVGWFATGLAFIAAGRLLGGTGRPVDARLPYAVYALNVLWSVAIATSAGMWPTALAALALGLAPAAFAFVPLRAPVAV